MTKSHTFPNVLKCNIRTYPKGHPAAQRRELLYHEVSPGVEVHPDAVQVSHSSPSSPPPTPRARPGGPAAPSQEGRPHPAVGPAFLPHHPLPGTGSSAPLTLR